MKNYKHIAVIIFAFIFVFACEKDDNPDFPLLQEATWVSSIRPTEFIDPFPLNEGEAISFVDLSQGALSHEFIIEEGNFFLDKSYKNSDSLPLFILPDAGTTTASKDAHVLFMKPGLNKIRLRNTYRDSVTYLAKEPIGAVFQDGVWVIENEWNIDVYGVLKPAFQVLDKDGNEILNITGDIETSIDDIETWPVVDVESGDALTFVDLTTEDRPTGRQWNFEGKPKNSPDEIVTVTFFKLGEFKAGVLRSIRADGLPENRVDKQIPILVNVIPSTKPYVFNGELKESRNEAISFATTGEVKEFSGQEASFTVNVKNDATGFDKNVTVSSAFVNPNDATEIRLVLSEPIYNTDVVTISYSGTGIESVDNRVLGSFGPEIVEMDPGENLLPNYFAGFESAHPNWKAAFSTGYWVGNNNGSLGQEFYKRTTQQIASGTAAMLYLAPEGVKAVNLQGLDFNKFNIPAGNYKLSITVFLAEGNTMSQLGTLVTKPWTVINWDLSTLERGVWHTLTQTVNFNEPPKEKYNIRVIPGDNPNALTGEQKFYLDDLSFTGFEPRP
ncbi:hypothetical protein A8C32_16935 [Flavivirga aquatica]|uniref:Uncharacterized protein n=1 Tax=Flavivirga aquatica TaxID=1849968 RepID=A0A1E5T8G7_9FLAO|nr:hypothetical protein [Flavivirga aquatica]OEK07664.1 hypothetical protein A8C32_16935 [Flavivirga aquatica]